MCGFIRFFCVLCIFVGFSQLCGCTGSNPASENDQGNADLIQEQILTEIPVGAVVAEDFSCFWDDTALFIVLSTCLCMDTILHSSADLRCCRYYLDKNALTLEVRRLLRTKDTLNAAVFMQYTRLVGDDGVSGLWGYDTIYYTLNTTPSDSDSIYVVNSVKWISDRRYAALVVWDGRFVTYRWKEPWEKPISFAARKIEALVDKSYRIHIDTISDSLLHLTGVMSGEKVFVEVDSADNVQFTSSTSLHVPHTYFSERTVCPNNFYPVWMKDGFLMKNRAYANFFVQSYGDTLSSRDIEVVQTYDFEVRLVNAARDTVWISEDSSQLGAVRYFSSNPKFGIHQFLTMNAVGPNNMEFPQWFVEGFLTGTSLFRNYD